MGIVHFAGLGASVGAVTSGLSYLAHKYGERTVQFGRTIEAVVLFTSPEVKTGLKQALPAEHNEYLCENVKKTWPRGKTNAVEIVCEFLRRELGNTEVYVYPVDTNDFSACFETVVKATLKFHPPGTEGKHLWANITGGTNPLNAALFQTAYLSGFIVRLYYTFISSTQRYCAYLQPLSRDRAHFHFTELYVLKTVFDERYRQILEVLEEMHRTEPNRWVTGEEVLGRLRSGNFPAFQPIEPHSFIRNFLHVMQGRGIERRGRDDAVRLDGTVGPKILSVLRADHVQALLQEQVRAREHVEELSRDLVIEKVSLMGARND
jgi:hypothetical protein